MYPATLSVTKPLPLMQKCNFEVSFYFPDDLLPFPSYGSLFPFLPSFHFLLLPWSHTLSIVESKVLELKLLEMRGLGLQPECKFMMGILSQALFFFFFF